MTERIRDYIVVKEISIPHASIGLYKKSDSYVIYRYAARGKISNFVSNYELVDNTKSSLIPMDLEHGYEILDRIQQGMSFSDTFMFYKNRTKDADALPATQSDNEHKFTSTGVKFWRHQEQLFNYKNNNPSTVISTHISPEGACNLKCPYCSVTYRDTHTRIPMDIIQDYVLKLKTRGLKAVILTGGGEPTSYKHFNELVRWIYAQDLSVAVVTNGSKIYWDKVEEDVCKMFTWVRVSINIYDGWVDKIALPLARFDEKTTTIGCSMVYTVENQASDEIVSDRVELLKKASLVATNCGAVYIRMLPNCLLNQENLINQHHSLDDILKQVNDKRFFHQYKVHGAPNTDVCHQSYFRPYLSEEVHKETGLPGTVYPCDSVVLNDAYQFYAEEYQLCHASDVLDYLDKTITAKFNPREQCKGCVHTGNVNMLDDWVNKGIDRFDEFPTPLTHENFV